MPNPYLLIFGAGLFTALALVAIGRGVRQVRGLIAAVATLTQQAAELKASVAAGQSSSTALSELVSSLSAQMAELEKRANPAGQHDLRYLERQDIGEATLFDLAKMREQLKLGMDWLDYASRRAAHVAGGGRPDDPPTKWSKEPK